MIQFRNINVILALYSDTVFEKVLFFELFMEAFTMGYYILGFIVACLIFAVISIIQDIRHEKEKRG